MVSSTDNTQPPEPLIFAPQSQSPQQLFVLLHANDAAPQQLESLQQAIARAFPASLIALPFAPLLTATSGRQWFETEGLEPSNYVARVHDALPALVRLIERLQSTYALSGEATALAGFAQGATMALEASTAQPDLAGRVLAFSGPYARLPATAPVATTLHLLHGAEDSAVPVGLMQETHAHLAELQGDATLDIASGVGHELHSALIKQGIHRLQTCVPLRSWQTAMSELNNDSSGTSADGDQDGEGPVLH